MFIKLNYASLIMFRCVSCIRNEQLVMLYTWEQKALVSQECPELVNFQSSVLKAFFFGVQLKLQSNSKP